MSVFEKFFKLNEKKIEDCKMDLLMQVTNNKMTVGEVTRVYQILNDQVKKMPKNVQVIEAMDLLKEIKGNWLTDEEKENFVTGVLMFDTLDTTNKKNLAYLNTEQLKYVKQAVLGSQFKKIREKQYLGEINEYKIKY